MVTRLRDFAPYRQSEQTGTRSYSLWLRVEMAARLLTHQEQQLVACLPWPLFGCVTQTSAERLAEVHRQTLKATWLISSYVCGNHIQTPFLDVDKALKSLKDKEDVRYENLASLLRAHAQKQDRFTGSAVVS